MFVAGTPGYVAGQEVLLLLERGPRGLRNVALSFSAFHVVPEGVAGAEAGVVRFAAGLDVLGERAESRRTRTLAEMRTIVGGDQGRPAGASDRRRHCRCREQRRRCASSSRSRCSATSRWRQADSGTTVNWYRNTDRPHPLTSGNIDTEITTAAAAWTNPTTASLILANGGHAQRRRIDRRVLHVDQRRRRLDQLRGSAGGRRLWACSRSAATARGGPTTTVNGTELLEHLARLRGVQPGRVARRLVPCRAELHARADARDRPCHRPRPSVRRLGPRVHRARCRPT